MLDIFSADQQDLQSPANGQLARQVEPSFGDAYAAAREANERVSGIDAEASNQHDYIKQQLDAYTAKTGDTITNPWGLDDGSRLDRVQSVREQMAKVAQQRNDPSLNFPTDDQIAAGGLSLARTAVQRQAELSRGAVPFGSLLGGTAAGAYDAATDPLNVISLAAAPEGGPLLAAALRMGGVMGAQTLAEDTLKYGYRQQVNPDYGVRDVAGDVAGAVAGGALFGAGHALGGEGIKAALGAAGGGAVGGAALGAIQGGTSGAIQGALGGAALPLAGAAFGGSAKMLGMGWRVLRETQPDVAANMPLDVRDAGVVAEKAGDIQAQNPFKGPNADAAHAEAVGKIEEDLLTGRDPQLPQSAMIEAGARRGQVFYPGGAIDARYDLAEHSDLVTSHDADFNVNPTYPPELQPRDRAGAPAQDQVNAIASNLQPDRLGPSPEANSGAPIVGPDGVVESGNGRVLAIGKAYDQNAGAASRYRQWLERSGFDTTGYDRPVLVGVRETAMDQGQRADFAHATNGSASLRLSATEQALSDARALDGSTLDLHQSADLAAASNRDFVRAVVAKLPQGERGGMLTRDGGLSSNGARRLSAAIAARAYADPGVLSRAFDHPDPNIKAIAGALTDAAAPWARMRDAATHGDIAPGHDITTDMLQAVKAIMRARDEKRPLWEVLNQGDIFQSDTTQLASRMFFRDEEMRLPAGRARVAEALTTYAEEARKNTAGGKLFDDDIAPVDVLRQATGLPSGIRERATELFSSGDVATPADAVAAALVERFDQQGFGTLHPRASFAQAGDLGERSVSAQMHAPEIFDALGADVPGTIVQPFGGPLAPEGGAFPNAPAGLVAYHGTPHDFDRFSRDHIGAGEGNQSYGHGLYFAENEGIARGYRDTLSNRDATLQLGGTGFNEDDFVGQEHRDALDHLKDEKGNIDKALQDALEASAKATAAGDQEQAAHWQQRADIFADWKDQDFKWGGSTGHLYQVRINRDPEHFLDWDKPSADQPRFAAAIEDRFGIEAGDHTAGWIVKDLGQEDGDPSEIAAALKELGVAGIKYDDAPSRRIGSGGEAHDVAVRVMDASGDRAGALIELKRRVDDLNRRRVKNRESVPQPDVPGQSTLEQAYKLLQDPSWKTGKTSNYVTFNDHDVVVTHKNGVALPDPTALPVFLRGEAKSAFGEELKAAGINRAGFSVDLTARAEKLLDSGMRADHGELSNKLMMQLCQARRRQMKYSAEQHRRIAAKLRKMAAAETNPEAKENLLTQASDGDAFGETGGAPGEPGGRAGLEPERGATTGYAAGRDPAGNPAQLGASWRRLSDRGIEAATASAADDVSAMARSSSDDLAPRVTRARDAALEGADAPREDLTVANAKTGERVQAQAVSSLADALETFDVSRDPGADLLSRAIHDAAGGLLADKIGDMKVFTVGPAEMRALAEGRMKVQPGFEPAGFFDPRAGRIVVLDDAMRNRTEASRLLVHEGLHGAFMRTINESENARAVIDQLRGSAIAAHMLTGGDAADHYGLTNAHEFVSEAFSNPDFQRFLASVPADDRLIRAFGLDQAPGQTMWDAFVGAVRRILGMAPDQHSLLDAAMRVGSLLDDTRDEAMRSDPMDVAPSMRLADPADRAAEAEERARRAKAFADVKDAIAYRINTDRIQQHPDGPVAGFLSILTRDIHENGGINVESVAKDYEGRMAEAVDKIREPYGSKLAGLKQDITGIRDVIRELFGVDTKNPVAKIAGEAWRGLDTFATTEAKRLGKVFTAAEDWRVPQFWESSRAQKFGKRTLLSDMEAEIEKGGLKIIDPDTGEEANPLRQRAILDGAADKIVTDASMGGTHGGAFKTDMRVFRFNEGQAGSDAYLRLMDKYGAGQGGYLKMMEAHVGKVSRELAMTRILGPGWAETGQTLLNDALLADKQARANRVRPEGFAERLKALPGQSGKFLTSWLESPAKAEAVWHYMSGQASGVGSELMAGILSGTRAYMTSTKMGSAAVTAVPADTVNFLMAARHNGMDMGRLVSAVAQAFLHDSPHLREEAARLGIVAHAGSDAAIGTKRFADQFVGEKLFQRLADFVIRAQGLHAWDSAIKRAFPMEFLGAFGQRGGMAFDKIDEPFGNFLRHYGFTEQDWTELSRVEHALPVGEARYLHPDNLPEPLRVKLMSAIYDERQFAYLAEGSMRVKAMSAGAKAGTLSGEAARAIFMFKSFPMSMLATWGMRAAREAGAGRFGTLATLITGMTMAGALSMQARSLLQGKDPRTMKDPYFWAESFLQGGAAGIYGDFFKEAFSRNDGSLVETLAGPLAAIPAGIQGLTSGARRAAEDGQNVNFGTKAARLLSQNVPVASSLWYTRLLASRLLFDNVQRMIDRDYSKSFARQQERSIKTNHQGFFWAPGQNTPSRGPDLGAMAGPR